MQLTAKLTALLPIQTGSGKNGQCRFIEDSNLLNIYLGNKVCDFRNK